MKGPCWQLILLAVAELFAMTCWFSATAVLPSLEAAWGVGSNGGAWLTAAVQLGFVVGALGAAMFNLPDLLPPRRLVAMSAVLAAVANFGLAWWVSSLGPALVLRFLTGVFLAGVYPPGMKIAAGHVSHRRRGLAIGWLVGALTLGSATPHLVAGLLAGPELPYRWVIAVSSVLALLGATIVALAVVDGPHAAPPAPFDPKMIGQVLRNRALNCVNLGYCGHMWELYAMWSWLVAFLAASMAPDAGVQAGLIAFASIGVAGVFGATAAGLAADRFGRTLVTIIAMLVSGSCCLLSPMMYEAAPIWLLVFGLIWGSSAVADSAQFSASVTELCDSSYVGTALTLQTSLGFALTMATIWGLPILAEWVGWQYAFVVLAPGPFLGCLAMARLRRLPEAVRLAGGRR